MTTGVNDEIVHTFLSRLRFLVGVYALLAVGCSPAARTDRATPKSSSSARSPAIEEKQRTAEEKEVEQRYAEGVRLAKVGKDRQAIACFDDVIRANHSHGGAYRNRGACRARLRKFADAKRDLDQALILNPRDAAALYNRGFVHDELKQYELAISDYSAVLAVDGQLARAYVSRGLSRFKSGDARGAIADYTQGINRRPGMKLALLLRAEAYDNQAEFERAARDRERAAALP